MLSGVGKLSRVVFYLLPKIKQSGLHVIENWKEYILPKYSCFGAIEEEHFVRRTRILPVLEKVNKRFLWKKIHRGCTRFLEAFFSNSLSTVAALSLVGQGWPEIGIWGDNYSFLHLFGQLLDRLLEIGWVGGFEVDAAKLEFHSSVRGQRLVEESAIRSRAPFISVLPFLQPVWFSLWKHFVQC